MMPRQTPLVCCFLQAAARLCKLQRLPNPGSALAVHPGWPPTLMLPVPHQARGTACTRTDTMHPSLLPLPALSCPARSCTFTSLLRAPLWSSRAPKPLMHRLQACHAVQCHHLPHYCLRCSRIASMALLLPATVLDTKLCSRALLASASSSATACAAAASAAFPPCAGALAVPVPPASAAVPAAPAQATGAVAAAESVTTAYELVVLASGAAPLPALVLAAPASECSAGALAPPVASAAAATTAAGAGATSVAAGDEAVAGGGGGEGEGAAACAAAAAAAAAGALPEPLRPLLAAGTGGASASTLPRAMASPSSTARAWRCDASHSSCRLFSSACRLASAASAS